MGTRADFYVGRGHDAEWLGSIAWDGYPEGIDHYVLEGVTEGDYRQAVDRFLGERDDSTRTEQGWPWPWDDSGTTDFAYAWDDDYGVVYASSYGSPWFRPIGDWERDLNRRDAASSRSALFPNMSGRRNPPRLGSKRSGVIAITKAGGS